MKKARKYKINIKRISINILIILTIFMIYNIFTSNIFGKKELKTENITIAAHDTLWNISSNICKSNSSLNVQEVINDIKEINGLENNNIVAGHTLAIPIYE